MTITTITRLKQLRDQLAGKLLPQRVERKRKEQQQMQEEFLRTCTQGFDTPESALTQLVVHPTPAKTNPVITMSPAVASWVASLDRFASFRDKIVPKLREGGYGYFLSCDSKQYQEHQEWCNDNCQDHSLPFCDVWQVDSRYPRAFADKTDAALFRIMFEAVLIEGDK